MSEITKPVPSLVEQYQQVIAKSDFDSIRIAMEQVARQNRRVRARCAEQILQIIRPEDAGAEGVCGISWVLHRYADEVDPGIVTIDEKYDRGILILNSNSADPFVTGTTGMDVHELAAWESQVPANFGGDGHSWWRAYYCVATARLGELVDFDAGGAAQYMNWYSASEELFWGTGTYGDGVDVEFDTDVFYGGSGVLVNATEGELTSKFGDLVQVFADFGYRTFDDLDLTMYFSQTGDFNRDDHRFNAIPGPIDWHLADTVDDEAEHMVRVGARIEVFPLGLEGSARALATHFAVRLRATCTETCIGGTTYAGGRTHVGDGPSTGVSLFTDERFDSERHLYIVWGLDLLDINGSIHTWTEIAPDMFYTIVTGPAPYDDFVARHHSSPMAFGSCANISRINLFDADEAGLTGIRIGYERTIIDPPTDPYWLSNEGIAVVCPDGTLNDMSGEGNDPPDPETMLTVLIPI